MAKRVSQLEVQLQQRPKSREKYRFDEPEKKGFDLVMRLFFFFFFFLQKKELESSQFFSLILSILLAIPFVTLSGNITSLKL